MQKVKTMKRFVALLLVFLALAPFSAMAQNANKTVTIDLSNATVSQVLEEVKKQTGLSFIMTSDLQNAAPRVTVKEKDAKVSTVLNKVLGRIGYSYSIEDGIIKITGAAKPGTRTITGRITDDQGEPLPGAYVKVRGTNDYASANAEGFYTLKTTSQAIVLNASYVGMNDQRIEIPMGNKPVKQDIVLLLNTELDEVVVTGYQEIDRTRLAGAVSTMKGEDLDLNGVNTLEQAMQGKLAGVAIQNQSGLVGVKQKTRVRGTSTLLGTQEPVWVVDGVIQETPLPFNATEFDTQGGITEDNFDYIRNFVGNSISWLNPMDIDNITVLKDASATAIYGVRAANGVIVIKTKRGKMGSMAVSYSGGVNFGERVSYNALERMNSKERVAVSKEIYNRGLIASTSGMSAGLGYAGALNKYLFKEITAEEFESQVARMETMNTDWFDLLYRNPVSHHHSVSFSGGYDKARYYASMSYNNTKGTAIGNGSESYGAHVGLNFNFSPKLHVSVDFNGTYSVTDGFFKTISPYTYAVNTNRAIPSHEDDGSLYFYKNLNGYNYNILYERDNSGNQNKNLTLTSSVNAYYNITPELKFNTMFNLNTSNVRGESWATERTNYITAMRFYEYGTALPTSPEYKNSRLPRGGEYNSDNTAQLTWGWRNSLQYDKLFNNVHAVTAMLGVEMHSTKYDGTRDTRYGYLPERGKSFAYVPATRINPVGNTVYANELAERYAPIITDTKSNNMGIYFTLNYAYDNRYVVNFSVRGDASNRFGQYHNEKFNPVWAGGLRWNVAKEKWFQEQDIVSDLSLRASFGYQRNMASNFSSSLILKIPSQTGAPVNIVDPRTGDYLLNIKSIPYDDLRWEKTFSQNYGADFGLFNNKIRVGIEYYHKKGTDIITTIPLPREYGIENLPVNSGSMVNKGYELTVGFTPIRTKDFTWNVSINTSKNWNTVTKVGMQSMNWETAKSGSFNKEGYAVGSFWAFKYDGIDPETGYPIIDLSTEEGADLTDPTSYMVYAGKLDPDFTGGLGLSFRYKQFTLSTSLYLQLGGKKFLTPAYVSTTLASEYENMSSELVNRWTPENKNVQFPGLPDYNVKSIALPNGNTYANVYEMYNYSTARIVSASSLRCNNLSLSYSVPSAWAKKVLRLQSISMGASVTNLFAINSKDFKGRDAEVATGQQPRTRSVSFNMSVAF